jgi:hypothetical protein
MDEGQGSIKLVICIEHSPAGRMYDEDLGSAIVSDKRMAQHSPILMLIMCPLSGFKVHNTFKPGYHHKSWCIGMKRDRLMEKGHQENASNAGLRLSGSSLQPTRAYLDLNSVSYTDMSQDFACVEVI